MAAGRDATLDSGLRPQQLHIVRSAYRLFGEQGAHAVTLDAIATRAGVSKGILLYYFKTRDNLILATMRWVLEATADRIRSAMAAARDPHGKLLAMVDAIWIDPDTNRRFYLAYIDLAGDAARHHAYSRLSQTFHAVVDGLYADAVREASPGRAAPEAAAPVIRAMVDGLALQWLQEPDWRAAHQRYRALCREAVLGYLDA